MNKKTLIIGFVALLLVMLPTASAFSYGGGGGGLGSTGITLIEARGDESYGPGMYGIVNIRAIECNDRTMGGGYIAINSIDIENARGKVIIRESGYDDLKLLEGVWFADITGDGIKPIPIRILLNYGDPEDPIIVEMHNDFNYDGSMDYIVRGDVDISHMP